VTPAKPKSHARLVIGGVLVTLLLAAVFTMGSLDVPIEPSSWGELMPLYAVNCFITAALLIFGLILTRSIVRLWAERSKEHLGASDVAIIRMRRLMLDSVRAFTERGATPLGLGAAIDDIYGAEGMLPLDQPWQRLLESGTPA